MFRLAFLLTLLPTLVLVDVKGLASVIDGDTIEILGQRIRLHGIDAPESDQQCQTKHGKPYDCVTNATRVLKLLVEGQTVRCEERLRAAVKDLMTTEPEGPLH